MRKAERGQAVRMTGNAAEWKPRTTDNHKPLLGRSPPYSFNLLHFACMLPFNLCISLLHIISCVLHVCLLGRCFSPDFKCYLKVIFKHYLKIGKELDL